MKLLEIGMSWTWLLVLVALIVLEAVTVQMVALWFIFGAIAAFIASMLGAGTALEIAVFVVVSGVSLLLLRPLVKKKLESDRVPTNADMVIGRTGIVTEDIDNLEGKGRVRAMELDWSARSYYTDQTIKKGTRVTACAIDGVKLIVVPVKEEN